MKKTAFFLLFLLLKFNGASAGTLAGDLNGNLSIVINRLALVTSAITSQAITTDNADTTSPYIPVTIPITFNDPANTALLPAIPPGAGFLLPPPSKPPFALGITAHTALTTSADASGTYGDDGSVTLENVPIHLSEFKDQATEWFKATFVVTLTTGAETIPAALTSAKQTLTNAGFALNQDQTAVVGAPIDPATLKLKLVGVSKFTEAEGAGLIAGGIGGSTGAVIVEATVNPPDVASPVNLTLEAPAPPSSLVGNDVTQTVTITNTHASAWATNVHLLAVVTPDKTSDFDFVSATATPEGECKTNDALPALVIDCDLGTLPSQASATVDVVLHPTAAGAIEQHFLVGADQEDPSADDNDQTVTLTAAPAPQNPQADLAVQKKDSADPVASGTPYAYTITVMNNGPDKATGVVVKDTLPSGMDYASSSVEACQYDTATRVITCPLGDLDNGATTSVDVTVQASQAGSLTNHAEVAGDLSDPDTANNQIDETTTAQSAGPLPKCGDGTVDPGEECDDGNTNESDACLSNCKLSGKPAGKPATAGGGGGCSLTGVAPVQPA